jgi:hypothetical protein
VARLVDAGVELSNAGMMSVVVMIDVPAEVPPSCFGGVGFGNGNGDSGPGPRLQ